MIISDKYNFRFFHDVPSIFTSALKNKYEVQPKMSTFSTPDIIWVNYAVLIQLYQPNFLQFVHWNSSWHNSVFELFRGILKIKIFFKLVCKLNYILANYFVLLKLMKISIFNSLKGWQILWLYLCWTLNKGVKGGNISFIHHKFINKLFFKKIRNILCLLTFYFEYNIFKKSIQ